MEQWTVPGYTELRPVGSGGFGAVMLATHDATGTPVAIKYLRSELASEPDFIALFRAEAVTLSSLDNPYVVRLYEYVEGPDGAAIVMELVDGVSLQQILAQQGKTTPEAALVVLYGSLLGLAATHAHGVVHRDYKPANVLVNGRGASKLTDFGIAERAGLRGPAAGTLAYAPPEQFDGSPARPTGDVYAATATFYECLTGHPPFTGQTTETMLHQHRSAEVPMAEVPVPLQPLIARGMAKDPGHRPADAADLAAELRTVAAGAYGQDWEARGRSNLAEAALLLVLAWPSAGSPGLTGTTVEQVALSQAAQEASHRASSRQTGHGPHPRQATMPHPLSQAQRHHLHLLHVLHLDHLAHEKYLRRLRNAALAVTAAAVVAAASTVALTSGSHPSGGSAAAGAAVNPPAVAYPVSLASTAAGTPPGGAAAAVNSIAGTYTFSRQATTCSYSSCALQPLVIDFDCPSSGQCVASTPDGEWGSSHEVTFNGNTIYFSALDPGPISCNGSPNPATITLNLTVVSWVVGQDSVRRPDHIQGLYTIANSATASCPTGYLTETLASG